MQTRGHLGVARWRSALFIVVGIAVGSLFAATPVYSHVGETVGHLWRDHIRPRADERYVQRITAQSRYVRVAYGTTRTNVTTGFQVLGPDGLHGVSILNDRDADEQSDIIIANDRSTGDILVLATGGPYELAPGEAVELSAGVAPILQAVITKKGKAARWSIYLWCGFNPALAGTPALARCITLNGTDSLFG
jgi:hypothetical protein